MGKAGVGKVDGIPKELVILVMLEAPGIPRLNGEGAGAGKPGKLVEPKLDPAAPKPNPFPKPLAELSTEVL